jgi:hypothetical protein
LDLGVVESFDLATRRQDTLAKQSDQTVQVPFAIPIFAAGDQLPLLQVFGETVGDPS